MDRFAVPTEYKNARVFFGESSLVGQREERAKTDPKVSGKTRSVINFATG